MGGLMPVGGGPDAEIISILNNLFRADNLAALRAHEALTGEKLFDKHHKLRRIAFRIGAYPARDYSPDDAKRKWFYFLHNVLPNATEKRIKEILEDAIRPSSPITAVEFFVEENAKTKKPHLFPSNSEKDLSAYLDPTKKKYWVRLIVEKPMDDIGEDQPDKPGDHDADDTGVDIERPITWPSHKLKRKGKSTKTKKTTVDSSKKKGKSSKKKGKK